MGSENQPNPGAALGPILQVNPDAAKNRGTADQAQRGAQQVQQSIHHQSTDPAYISDLEQWDTLSHQDIYTMVQSINTAAMHTHAKAWQDIAAALGGGLFGLNISIQRELSAGFHGQFAGAAAEAATKFIQQATDVQEVITVVSARINAAAYGAEAAKLAVPAPGQQLGVAGVNALAPGLPAAAPGPEIDDRKAAENLRHLAVEAMQNNYNPTYRPAGENVPTFVPVDSPGDGGTNNPNSGGPYSSNGPSTPGKTTSPGDQQKPGDQDKQPSSDQSQQTDPASTSQGRGNQPGNQNSNPGSSLPGGNTTPAGVDSTSAAGFGGPGSGVGSSGGLGGTSGGAPGGPGRSVPGMPGGGTPSAAASFGARSGQAGASGMPGMGGLGGARKNEDSEKEHKTPDYLVMDREEELFGRQDPALGGAIGADIPAAQFRPEDRERRR